MEKQLLLSGILPAQISKFIRDTVSDLRYESFRRDREKSGRQMSFIALKDR